MVHLLLPLQHLRRNRARQAALRTGGQMNCAAAADAAATSVPGLHGRGGAAAHGAVSDLAGGAAAGAAEEQLQGLPCEVVRRPGCGGLPPGPAAAHPAAVGRAPSKLCRATALAKVQHAVHSVPLLDEFNQPERHLHIRYHY